LQGWRKSAVLTTFHEVRAAAWGFLDLADLIAPTDPMTDLLDKNRPRRPAPLEGARVIAIRGAREHNLKNIDLEIPRDRLVVFTGLSGSGKSSLAFDTIYAEG
jgi:ABC-type bacteriocin/lantibiotic exporter with double-glycine peptidase domain